MRSSPFYRRLSLGLLTLLGLRQQGYFIPYRYADTIPDSTERRTYAWLDVWFKTQKPVFLKLLGNPELIQNLAQRFNDTEPPMPRWQQTWFPRLDGLAAYLMVHHHRPSRIVEVGSGHSTRFISQAVQDLQLNTQINAIDPAPRADIATLPSVTVHKKVLQEAPERLFEDLRRGDFLMIDSSHISMPGTDVDWLLGHILPSVPKGVFIQIHDIFLPDPYPETWSWRGYNEQLPVATLLAGGKYQPIWSSHWLATRARSDLNKAGIFSIPIADGAPETALWLEKT